MKGLKHTIKPTTYPKAKSYESCDELSYSTVSSNSELVQLASYEINTLSFNSNDSDVARVQSYTSEEEKTKHPRFTVTVEDDSTESESMPSSQESYQFVSSKGSDLVVADSNVSMDGRQIQKKTGSFLGALFSYMSPSYPQEMAVRQPISQVATTRAMIQPKEDALDYVFNALETFACRDGDDIRDIRENRTMGAPARMRHENDILDNVFESVQIFICRDSENSEQGDWGRPVQLQTQSGVEQRKDTVLSKYEKDILDNVFEGVENVACSYDYAHNSKIVANNNARVVPYEWDILDSVFEGVERATCRKEYREEPWQIERDIRADMLDRVCQHMEYAVCKDNGAVVLAKNPDMLDNICESLEYAACQEASRTGDPKDIIEQTQYGYNLDQNNSILERDPVPDFESERRELWGEKGFEKRRNRTREASTKKVSYCKRFQTREEDEDIIDLVF